MYQPFFALIYHGLGHLRHRLSVSQLKVGLTLVLFACFNQSCAFKIANQDLINAAKNATSSSTPVLSAVSWNVAPAVTYTASSTVPMSSFSVQVLDAAGAVITTNSTTTITLSLTTGTGTLG